MSRAWEDEDDKSLSISLSQTDRTKKLGTESEISGTEYTERLRQKYSSFYQTSWATTSTQESSLSKLFLTSKSILSDKSHSLPSGRIDITQLPASNQDHFSRGVVTACEFQSNLLLIGSRDKRLKVFEVPSDPENSLRTSMCFQDLPITNAHFCGEKIYVSGDRPYFYLFDLTKESSQRIPFIGSHSRLPLGPMRISPDNRYLIFAGQNGKLLQVSCQSQKVIHEFKMNSNCNGICFIDENTVACGGDEGDVYVWDLNMRQCVHRFADEGSIKITCMDSNEGMLAVGSNTGVVNVYNSKAEGFYGENPKPVKSVMNLTTAVDGVVFNKNNEMLMMYSRWKKDAVKLMHLGSMTVFANWPSFKDHLKFPMCAAFNSTSELLTVGNDEGVALLYKINHYS